jgi:DNA-binding NtrC family response regulator
LPLRQYLKAAERQYLARVLEHYRGGIGPAAKHAVIDQATMHRKIRLHGLRPGDLRRNGDGGRGEEES